MDLFALGWSGDFSADDIDSGSVARIVAVHKGLYKAVSEEGNINCYLSGKYQFCSDEDIIAVGDWVVLSQSFVDEQNKPAALIQQLLPRKSRISRVASGVTSNEQIIAANVDYAFIVTSINADLNINRLHRYIMVTRDGGVTPVIIFSKIDLAEDSSTLLNKMQKKLPDIDIICTSVKDSTGLDALASYCSRPAITSVFIGSSGVGKSSLVNELLGEQLQETKTIREDDAKGRHTTTARSLFFTPEGGMIIDTPGLRELQVFGDEDQLGSMFQSIETLQQDCKFSDCTHTSEPGCRILEAIENGELDKQELVSYHKLLREIEFSNRKMDKRHESNKKRKWKTVTKAMRNKKKLEKRDEY